MVEIRSLFIVLYLHYQTILAQFKLQQSTHVVPVRRV